MTGKTGRYIGMFALLCLCAAAAVTVLLWSPTQARQAAAGTGGSAASVIVEVEQAALSGPARAGSSNGAGYVQFGDSAPQGGFQPTAPYYATFYYPWYGSPAVDGHWSYWTGQNNQPPATWFSHYLPDPQPGKFDPSQELYSSHDPAVLYWQFAKMAEAKVEVAISSWWGKDDRTDDNFSFILKNVMHRSDNPYPNLRWALYYEVESNSNPSAAAIASDLDYIAEQYAGEPGYLKIDGKPVLFVYSDGDNGPELVQRWNQAKLLAKVPFYVVLKVFNGYKDVSPQPDSWHQYGPASRESKQTPYSYSVSPGFWFDSNGEAPRLDRNLAEFRSAVSRMVAVDAVWKLVTTWNEWGEGTAVEPGEQVTYDSSTERDIPDPAGAQFKNAYIDALHELLPPLEAGTGQALTLAAVPARTPTAARNTAVVTDSFSFAVAGDLGGASKATASFEALANLVPPADFFLAVGDMSYDEVKPESAWCDYVHQYVGDTYPFEVLVGNHEEQPSGPNGFIDTFAGCLPDHLGVSGLYAHRYYFDYPAGAPLARFILIDPDLYRGATVAEYCTGSDTENCDWLKARVDEAKSQGLWTIVGMHKNCLTIGEKSCEIGADLLNMLINLKVDLVLQGHDHGYQRSKQFRLGASCSAVAPRAYDAGCVVDDGADGGYTKGAGMVFIISGAFGRSTYAVNPADPEAGYIASWMLPADNSNGFMQFTVSKDAIDGRFVNSRGDFSDHIKISTSGAPPPPTPTPSPTPTGTPQPTACANPAGAIGLAVLTANFPAAATYYVWTRLMAADAAHNAFWLQLDNTCPVQVVGKQPGAWEWINYQQGATDAPILEQLSAGTHTIRLYGLHAGVKVDKLMFTTELNPILPSIPPTGAPRHLFLPQVHS